MTSVKFPASITHLPNFGFVNNNLQHIEFTNLDITFGMEPFRFNQLRYITIPEGTADTMKEKLHEDVLGWDNRGAILREGTTNMYQWTYRDPGLEWIPLY